MRLARTALLRNLSVFCVAARTLSFKDSAHLLHLTPSAVSHQIRELERVLNLPLFVRKTRALELTAAGRLLLYDVEPHLRALETAVDAAAPRKQRRQVRIALPPFFATELLIPRLAAFRMLHEDVEIGLDSHDTLPREPAGSADLSIFIGNIADSSWELQRLFPLQMVAACAPTLQSQCDLAGSSLLTSMQVFVHRRFAGSAAAWAEQADCETPHARNIVELDDTYAVARSAEQGLGIALLPCIVTESWFQRGALVLARPTVASTGEHYVLANRAIDNNHPHVKTVRDWVLAQFSEHMKASHASIMKPSLVA